MSVCGKYVKTFAEASHALPEDMHMSADYPFMLPPIKSIDGKNMVIVGKMGQEATVKIIKRGDQEVAFIKQSSHYEQFYGLKPYRFTLYPFKDESSPAVRPSLALGDLA